MLNAEQLKLAAALQAAMNGDAEGVLDMPDGTKLRVERTQEPGVKAVLRHEPDTGFAARVFEPLQTAPVSYPSYLPFVAGVPAMVGSDSGEKRFANWFGIRDRESTLAMLTAHSERAGWALIETKTESTPLGEVKTAHFSKGSFRRIVMTGGIAMFGFATLVDQPVDPAISLRTPALPRHSRRARCRCRGE